MIIKLKRLEVMLLFVLGLKGYCLRGVPVVDRPGVGPGEHGKPLVPLQKRGKFENMEAERGTTESMRKLGSADQLCFLFVNDG